MPLLPSSAATQQRVFILFIAVLTGFISGAFFEAADGAFAVVVPVVLVDDLLRAAGGEGADRAVATAL